MLHQRMATPSRAINALSIKADLNRSLRSALGPAPGRIKAPVDEAPTLAGINRFPGRITLIGRVGGPYPTNTSIKVPRKAPGAAEKFVCLPRAYLDFIQVQAA